MCKGREFRVCGRAAGPMCTFVATPQGTCDLQFRDEEAGLRERKCPQRDGTGPAVKLWPQRSTHRPRENQGFEHLNDPCFNVH